MSGHKLKIASLILAVLVAIGLAGVVTFRALDKALDMRPPMGTKARRELTATVKGKGYRKYDETNYAYIDHGRYIYKDEEGGEVQRYPGNEDWLIYYEIDHFDPRDEPMSSCLIEAEKKRAASGNQRATIFTKDQYEQVKVGDKIHLSYQRFNDCTLMQIW